MYTYRKVYTWKGRKKDRGTVTAAGVRKKDMKNGKRKQSSAQRKIRVFFFILPSRLKIQNPKSGIEDRGLTTGIKDRGSKT